MVHLNITVPRRVVEDLVGELLLKVESHQVLPRDDALDDVPAVCHRQVSQPECTEDYICPLQRELLLYRHRRLVDVWLLKQGREPIVNNKQHVLHNVNIIIPLYYSAQLSMLAFDPGVTLYSSQ